MATVFMPTPLRRLTGGQAKVEAEGQDISGLIDHLDELHPGLKERVCLQDGEVKPYVNVFLNGEEIRTLQGIRTSVGAEDEVHIIPAMAGGSRVGLPQLTHGHPAMLSGGRNIPTDRFCLWAGPSER